MIVNYHTFIKRAKRFYATVTVSGRERRQKKTLYEAGVASDALPELCFLHVRHIKWNWKRSLSRSCEKDTTEKKYELEASVLGTEIQLGWKKQRQTINSCSFKGEAVEKWEFRAYTRRQAFRPRTSLCSPLCFRFSQRVSFPPSLSRALRESSRCGHFFWITSHAMLWSWAWKRKIWIIYFHWNSFATSHSSASILSSLTFLCLSFGRAREGRKKLKPLRDQKATRDFIIYRCYLWWRCALRYISIRPHSAASGLFFPFASSPRGLTSAPAVIVSHLECQRSRI